MDEQIFEKLVGASLNLPNLPRESEKELFMCSNCKEIVPEDYGKHTEHDGFICEQCLNDGYGK